MGEYNDDLMDRLVGALEVAVRVANDGRSRCLYCDGTIHFHRPPYDEHKPDCPASVLLGLDAEAQI